MTKLKIAIGIVMVVGAAMLWTIQRQTEIRLREENQSLRGQLDQLEADNERLSNLVAQANSRLSNEQFMELLKLRGEVGLLRRQINEPQPLRRQNQQLQAGQNTSNNLLATNLPSEVPPLAVYSKESLAFTGYATPETALQSLLWAVSNGEANRLLDGMSPDVQKDFARSNESKSESDIANLIKQGQEKTTEFRILNKEVLSDTEVVFSVIGDGDRSDNNPERMVFKKIDGQWKLVSGH